MNDNPPIGCSRNKVMLKKSNYLPSSYTGPMVTAPNGVVFLPKAVHLLQVNNILTLLLERLTTFLYQITPLMLVSELLLYVSSNRELLVALSQCNFSVVANSCSRLYLVIWSSNTNSRWTGTRIITFPPLIGRVGGPYSRGGNKWWPVRSGPAQTNTRTQ